MPVCNYDGEVIGVAQIMNKRDGCNDEFTETDLKVGRVKNSILIGFFGDKYHDCLKFKIPMLFFIGFRALLDILRHRHPERPALRSLHSRIQEEQGQDGHFSNRQRAFAL